MLNKKLKLFNVTIIILMLITITLIYTNQSRIVWLDKLLPITDVKTNENVVAIACNVYEGKDEINKMLKILNKKNIKISFFIGGIWAQNNKDMLMVLKNSNQDIQNHGYYHKLPTRISVSKNIMEIKATEDLIYKACGERTNLFEPPSGDYDENTLTIANSIQYKVITWSIDTIDWRSDATRTLIINRIKKKLHPGAIILIHPKKVTAESFEDILNYIEGQGYKITSVTNLINNY